MEDIITFQSFDTEEEAVNMSMLLYQKGVSSRIKKSQPSWVAQALSGDLPSVFHVQINEEDLMKANNILENSK